MFVIDCIFSVSVNSLENISATADQQTGCITMELKIGGHKKSVTLTPNLVDNLLTDLTDVKKNMIELKEAL